jgi:hypothetical protein
VPRDLTGESEVFPDEQRARAVRNTKAYLAKFGYMRPCTCEDATDCSDFRAGLERYQLFFGLPVTGNLDRATIYQMRKPRCGLPDVSPDEDVAKRVDDYSLSGGKWSTNALTYWFQNGTGDIGGTTEWDLLRQALDRWAFVTPLSFSAATTESAADIRFRWATGDHGDGSPFDGFGNVLAHGFYPPPVNSQPIAGDVHFDDDENWDTEDGGWWFWRRRDLLTVATHEVGHALGLQHSSVGSAVMWPTYEGERRVLTQDDIDGIQAIYGPPVAMPSGAFAEASIFALKNTGGYGTVTVDLGRMRRVLAWGTVTMIDSLSDFDRDNAVVVEVWKVDGSETWKAVSGGDNWGTPGTSSNVHQGAFVGRGQQVTFRLRAFHADDFDAYGMGHVVALD